MPVPATKARTGGGLAKPTAPRKRRPHTKSRKGCRNCKLRGIKCDETKSGCQKCMAFGVNCNYSPSVPDLQINTNPVKAPPDPKNNLPLIKKPLVGVFAAISDAESTFQLDTQSLDRLSRFQSRTVLSVGTRRGAKLLQNVAVDLTFTSPILMHVVQAITLMHDRYSSGSTGFQQTPAENYHLARAASLFHKKLSMPIRLEDRDALWCSSSMLGVIAFAAIEASTPEQAWPLKKSELSDLGWMEMSKNKQVIWQLTDPFRSDGPFRSLAEEFHATFHAITKITSGIEGIPIGFVNLCNLNHESTADNSPYYQAIRALSVLVGVQYDQERVVRFLFFLGNMRQEFKKLLEKKDPRALLILLYWYSTWWNSVWWVEKRARLESQAICIYLERYHSDDKRIMKLLELPKMHFGFLENLTPELSSVPETRLLPA